MELELPWLESQDFIERCAWFECFNVDVVEARCNLKENGDVNGALTESGQYYSDYASTMAIPEDSWIWIDLVLLSGSAIALNGGAIPFRVEEEIEKERNPLRSSYKSYPIR